MADDMGKTKKMCPNGHVMDPAWEVCPYCPSDRAGSSELAKTVRVEDAEAQAQTPPVESRKTEILRTQPSINAVAWLVATKGPAVGTIHTIRSEKATLGAASDSDVRIDEPHVSDQHASMRFQNGGFALTDLDSTNGTFVNGKKIAKKVLADGDQIKLGSSEWVFKSVQWED
ncbi:MAG: FHA domain-containing protein [Candidatus Eisenbacteria bacterium]|nr:FHA domain-containing protein [Candidatus Eisenbacteria bacterium]